MKTQLVSKLSAVALFIAIASTSFVSCVDDDDSDVELTGQSKTYTLYSVSDASISGTVKFAERSDNATVITIDLDGTSSGQTHPAHIHANSAVETGDIIINLNPVNGETGISETVVKKMDNGTNISYNQLLTLDGYLNVHTSEDNLTTLIAQGDIGKNELTTIKTTYILNSINASGITGTVTFTKRVSDSTLVVVDLEGVSPTGEYPVYIYSDDILSTGPITIDLVAVDGADGVSYTDVALLNDGTAITYQQLTAYDGHVNVLASPIDPTFVANANLGSNAGQ